MPACPACRRHARHQSFCTSMPSREWTMACERGAAVGGLGLRIAPFPAKAMQIWAALDAQ